MGVESKHIQLQLIYHERNKDKTELYNKNRYRSCTHH